MEGHEISVLNLSEVLEENNNHRIDSEYFKKKFIDFFKEVPNLKPLGSFVKEGYRVVYENTKIIEEREAIENEYPYFLQATDLNTPFINTQNLYHVHEDEWKRYKKGRIKKGEILIEVKGKIDKVAIVPEDFPEKTLVTGSLFKMTVNEKINKHVLLTYLISSYGTAFKDRFKTNLLISYVSKPDLYRIPVPHFSEILQKKIDLIFKKIFAYQNESNLLYKKAENYLLKEVGLLNFSESQLNTNVKLLSKSLASTDRLDAEYYQPKYEEVVRIASSKKNKSLSDIVDIVKSVEPGSKYYDDEGIPFLRVADYNQFEVLNAQKFLSKSYYESNKKKLSKLKPKKGTILLSKDGSIGTAYLLRNDYQGITSGAILHLRIKDKNFISPEYLTLVLNSKIVQMQAERDSGGSIIQHWRVSQIEKVVIPLVNDTIQNEISEMISTSFDYREWAKSLLSIAIKSIELSIEVGENKALDYLEERVVNYNLPEKIYD